jgi:nucleotide-binding universal stress UspA family protein
MIVQSPPFTIDAEFQSLIPPLTPLEREGLELSIISSGCREPLIIWSEENILIDGHNRHAICVERGIQYQVRAISLPDRVAVIDWIIANQLSRRNLSPFYLSYFRGKYYNREKSQGERRDLTSGQNVQKLSEGELTSGQNVQKLSEGELTSGQNVQKLDEQNLTSRQNVQKLDDQELTTAQKLATLHGVNEKTIRRDGKYAEAIDTLTEVFGNRLRIGDLDRNTAFSRKMILDLAEIARKDPSAAFIALEDIEKREMPLSKALHLELEKGTLVEVKCDKPKLRHRLGRVESVAEATVTVYVRDTDRMEMEKYRLKFQDVEPVAPDKEPRVQELMTRIDAIRSKGVDPFERELLDLLERRVALTPVEEEYLRLIEQRYRG